MLSRERFLPGWRRRWALLCDAWQCREVPFPIEAWSLALLNSDRAARLANDLYAQAKSKGASFEAYSTDVLGPYLPADRIAADAKRRNATIIVGYFPFRTCADVAAEAARQSVPCYLMPLFHPLDVTHHNRALQQAVHDATGVLTLSPFAAEFFDKVARANRAVYVGSAPPEANCAVNAEAQTPRQADSTPYFVFFGRNDPSKNLGEAVWITEQVSRESGRSHALKVIARHSDSLENSLPPGSEILPDLPGDRVAHVLSGAQGLLFPSLHESFGIVVMEALQLGIPAWVREGNLATSSILRALKRNDLLYKDAQDCVSKLLAAKATGGPRKPVSCSWNEVAARVLDELQCSARIVQE